MSKLVVMTAAEQVAAHLRGELLAGTWRGRMPGGDRLAAELAIGRDTVESALKQLEAAGLLENQGRRRGRRIVSAAGFPARGIRVAILAYEAQDRGMPYVIELQHELEEAGHTVVHAPKNLIDLEMDVGRVARLVKATEADAWIVLGGSGAVLEWFASRGTPAFALFGRRSGVRIASAGPDKPPVMAEVTRVLVKLGHRRIVLMAREMRRVPQPGATERAFLETLEAHGVPAGAYHLPDWQENVAGFHARLDSLFLLTPPTALIVDEVPLFAAAHQFLARKGLRVPEDVSLVCTDYDPSFEWSMPEISHIRWDSKPVVKRMMQWVNHISRGKDDRRQTLTRARFVRGGTIGPARDG